MRRLLFAFVMGLAACDLATEEGEEGAGKGEGEGEGEDGEAIVIINEVMAKNTATLATAGGDFADWIELWNPGDVAVKLEGWTLADSSAPVGFVVGAVVPARGFLVVFANDALDGGSAAEPAFPWKLSSEGEVLVLARNGVEVDRVLTPLLTADESAGRLPDGEGNLLPLSQASPGRPNAEGREGEGEACVASAATAIVVNEVLVDNVAGIVDGDGDQAAWVELWNSGAGEVSLAGLFLADNAAGVGSFALPNQLLAAGGFVVFFADLDVAAGPDHLGFLLNNDDTAVVLFDDCGATLQEFPLSGGAVDIAVGRVPDGGDDIVAAPPTPGASNGASP